MYLSCISFVFAGQTFRACPRNIKRPDASGYGVLRIETSERGFASLSKAKALPYMHAVKKVIPRPTPLGVGAPKGRGTHPEDGSGGVKGALAACLIPLVFILNSCTPNNPYRAEEKQKNVLYSSFEAPPKHLDPAKSYSSDEYDILSQIYEPIIQYHYLKRPFELIPLTTTRVPEPAYFDRFGRRLPQNASPSEVKKAVYEIKIKKGILYQNHPAFAKAKDNMPLYAGLKEKDLKGIKEISDFPVTGTRELTSDDYIYQIKRLADPRLQCPILPILEKYIAGLKDYSAALADDLEKIRAERKRFIGASYNQTTDEAENPILPDYDKHALAGVEKIDSHTFRITLTAKYPQFIYWLSMPFFSPMPKEADIFYRQSVLAKRNLTLDRFPVGTGPFRMESYKPQMEMTFVKNENFRDERYPSEGAEGDKSAGLLDDAGKPMPFLEKIVFKLEKEDIPRWNKFLQGYYDLSGITSDSFDQAVTMGQGGKTELTPAMKEKDIGLLTSVRPATYYSGFNMLDPAIGGYTEDKKKLRRAITIALDHEEYIEIFANGRGMPAMGPVPPGIFGRVEGRDGVNPFIYDWDEEKKKPKRKTIEEAKRLLSEAGFENGRDAQGRPLVITFDNPYTGVDAQPLINWYAKRFKLLGIRLENRTTDYNRFQEKMLKGNFQFYAWGWNADYPDPENFFFLLASGNSKVKHQGENASNYSNPRFDELFREMENMDNSEERLIIIKKMTRILNEDSPWTWGFHPVAFTLSHGWVKNLKPNAMANNTMKYYRVDPEKRSRLREAWNAPEVLPIILAIIFLVLASLPAIISVGRKLGFLKR